MWDCFLFNDELDLLKLRLDELSPVVDRFVLVESAMTHSGRSKALLFNQEKARFAEYLPRIVHVAMPELPAPTGSPREREKAQHAGIKLGLDGLDPHDLVIVGDVDEIPDRDVLTELAGELSTPVRLVMRHSIYFANWKLPNDWFDGPKVCRGVDLDSDEMGVLMGRPQIAWDLAWDTRQPESGWHLSFLGGAQAIIDKFEAYPHQEFNNPADKSYAHLERCLRFGVDFRGRERISVVAEQDFDPLLRRLFTRAPQLFLFPPQEPGWKRAIYQSYARGRKYAPTNVVSWTDSHPRLTLNVIGPALFGADLLIHKMRRL